ncbi:hypothetical protein TVNIR_1772 [Thioalkalivibrio nitratireducens DSM 14787]|uniref:Uncharacterized protein n=1 Tax=Thioalkalivibrio nitratireducens (strain DSM 14787 / UNIQEM 213 / ALEN2) TaxID=1255043 RepID=L0DV17_THIND|nr:hypothetical protein [Thioalkalivibrio nitratireducens]AGA33434.1 hypothetical protein TVNIR_1772 [Thioalkalivibrio nitratireducens DSM 14787]
MTAVLALLGAGIGISTAQAGVTPGLSSEKPDSLHTAQVPAPDSRQIKIDGVDGVGVPASRQPRIDVVAPRESNQIKWEYAPHRERHQLKLDR